MQCRDIADNKSGYTTESKFFFSHFFFKKKILHKLTQIRDHYIQRRILLSNCLQSPANSDSLQHDDFTLVAHHIPCRQAKSTPNASDCDRVEDSNMTLFDDTHLSHVMDDHTMSSRRRPFVKSSRCSSVLRAPHYWRHRRSLDQAQSSLKKKKKTP